MGPMFRRLPLACLLLLACRETPRSPEDQPPVAPPHTGGPDAGPRLADVASPVVPLVLGPEDQALLETPKAALPVSVLRLPLRMSTDLALELVKAPDLPAPTLDYLRANGLRLGTLETGKFGEFDRLLAAGDPAPDADLPANRRGVLTVTRSTLTACSVPQPLARGPRLAAVQLAGDEAPGGAPPTRLSVPPGGCAQLVVQGEVASNQLQRMVLRPQIHRPTVRLQPLRPWEREVEGRFLAGIELPPPPAGQVYVLALHWPWEEIKADSTGPVPAPPAEGPPPAPAAKPDAAADEKKPVRHFRPTALVPSFGSALLVHAEGGTLQQNIILIGR